MSNRLPANVMNHDRSLLQFKLQQATQLRDRAQGPERDRLDAAVSAYTAALKAETAFEVTPGYQQVIGSLGAMGGTALALARYAPKVDPVPAFLGIAASMFIGDSVASGIHSLTHFVDWSKLDPQLKTADETVASAIAGK